MEDVPLSGELSSVDDTAVEEPITHHHHHGANDDLMNGMVMNVVVDDDVEGDQSREAVEEQETGAGGEQEINHQAIVDRAANVAAAAVEDAGLEGMHAEASEKHRDEDAGSEGGPNWTVLVTDGDGYIASHIVWQLLEKGYNVRAGVPSTFRGSAVSGEARKKAFEKLNAKAIADGRLSLVRCDADMDVGEWDRAVKDCQAVFHVACTQEDNRHAHSSGLSGPQKEDKAGGAATPAATSSTPEAGGESEALDMISAVMNACIRSRTVRRVIMTASLTAVLEGHKRSRYEEGPVFSENDWSVEEKARSKDKVDIAVEKSAWDIMAKANPSVSYPSPPKAEQPPGGEHGEKTSRKKEEPTVVVTSPATESGKGEETSKEENAAPPDPKDDAAPHLKVVAICAGTAMGPPLLVEHVHSRANDAVKKLMKASLTVYNDDQMPLIDVRDLAAIHVKALEAPDDAVCNQRVIAAAEGGSLSLSQMGKVLHSVFHPFGFSPSTKVTPPLTKRLEGYWKAEGKKSTRPPDVDTSKLKKTLGVECRDVRETAFESVVALMKLGALACNSASPSAIESFSAYESPLAAMKSSPSSTAADGVVTEDGLTKLLMTDEQKAAFEKRKQEEVAKQKDKEAKKKAALGSAETIVRTATVTPAASTSTVTATDMATVAAASPDTVGEAASATTAAAPAPSTGEEVVAAESKKATAVVEEKKKSVGGGLFGGVRRKSKSATAAGHQEPPEGTAATTTDAAANLSEGDGAATAMTTATGEEQAPAKAKKGWLAKLGTRDLKGKGGGETTAAAGSGGGDCAVEGDHTAAAAAATAMQHVDAENKVDAKTASGEGTGEEVKEAKGVRGWIQRFGTRDGREKEAPSPSSSSSVKKKEAASTEAFTVDGVGDENAPKVEAKSEKKAGRSSTKGWLMGSSSKKKDTSAAAPAEVAAPTKTTGAATGPESAAAAATDAPVADEAAAGAATEAATDAPVADEAAAEAETGAEVATGAAETAAEVAAAEAETGAEVATGAATGAEVATGAATETAAEAVTDAPAADEAAAEAATDAPIADEAAAGAATEAEPAGGAEVATDPPTATRAETKERLAECGESGTEAVIEESVAEAASAVVDAVAGDAAVGGEVRSNNKSKKKSAKKSRTTESVGQGAEKAAARSTTTGEILETAKGAARVAQPAPPAAEEGSST